MSDKEVYIVFHEFYNTDIFADVKPEKRIWTREKTPAYASSDYDKAISWIKENGPKLTGIYTEWFTAMKIMLDSTGVNNPTHVEHFDKNGNKLAVEPPVPTDIPRNCKGGPPFQAVSG